MAIIRERADSDIPALRALFLKARQTTFTWLNTTGYKLSDFDEETAGEYILVGVEDGYVIGFISVWMEDNFIHHLYVDDAYQNTGVGSALLNAAVKRTGLPVRLKCVSRNIKARGFYIRKGFVEAAYGHNDDGPYILFELGEMAASPPVRPSGAAR